MRGSKQGNAHVTILETIRNNTGGRVKETP